MNKYAVYILTVWKLGVLNVLTVLVHRLKLKFGYFCRQKQNNLNVMEQLYVVNEQNNFSKEREKLSKSVLSLTEDLLNGKFLLFFHQLYQTTSPPNWFYHLEYSKKDHWSKQKINSLPGHDIKLTWELSRFQWLPLFALAYKLTDESKYLSSMNLWCADWISNNPVNFSVNWSCGQECAIRIINTLNATHILNGKLLHLYALQKFVIVHLKRIEPAISYSIAQDNNHGISEAAGLYIGAAWLESQSGLNQENIKFAKRLKRKGQRLLENRIQKLVGEDGGFAMSSTNYHRVVLNTVAIVEFWRKNLNLPPFSSSYQTKCKALCNWLFKLTDSNSGGVPNLGANDGSNPFIIQTVLDYNDFRPAIQFAVYHFFNALAYIHNPSINEPLQHFDIPTTNISLYSFAKKCEVLASSGIVVFKPSGSDSSHALLKFPVNRFRPYQADMFHFDLWTKGVNILSDAGSYSYAAEDVVIQDYFSSIKAHNTIQIDEVEPMIRLSPFLLGQWPKMTLNESLNEPNGSFSWKGSFNWPSGASHQREVHCLNNKWIIKDRVRGARKNITLRWRLHQSDWVLNDNIVSNSELTISIKELNGNLVTSSIEDSFNSRYYNAIQTSPMLVVKAESKEVNFLTEIFI